MQTSAAHATFDRTLCEAVSIVVLSMTLPISSPSIILSANSMFRVLPLMPECNVRLRARLLCQKSKNDAPELALRHVP